MLARLVYQGKEEWIPAVAEDIIRERVRSSHVLALPTNKQQVRNVGHAAAARRRFARAKQAQIRASRGAGVRDFIWTCGSLLEP